LLLVDGVLPAMRERHWGRIVALTSAAVKQPMPPRFRTRTARRSSAHSKRSQVKLPAKAGSRERKRAAAGVPIGRAATPEEFAPLVAFLCGEPASYITGCDEALRERYQASAK
jgi:3-oxoacyl-[acyl-carrier protein] reductase